MREDDATGAIYLPLTTLAGAIGNLPVVNGMYDFQLSQFGLTTLPGSYAFNVARLSEMLNFTSSRDHAGYDLSLRGAYDINCQIKVQPGIYYSPMPPAQRKRTAKANWVPISSMETIFKAPSFLIGRKAEPIPPHSAWRSTPNGGKTTGLSTPSPLCAHFRSPA